MSQCKIFYFFTFIYNLNKNDPNKSAAGKKLDL